MEKLPPLEKVYEAYSAIADGRVTLGEYEAGVRSSDGAKEYTVAWDGDIYSSTDNATYWQGYAGYPVLAVLMLQGRLPLDRALTDRFTGVDWHTLNARHKRNYASAAHEAMEQKGIPAREVEDEARRVLEALAALPITLRRGKRQTKKSEA